MMRMTTEDDVILVVKLKMLLCNIFSFSSKIALVIILYLSFVFFFPIFRIRCIRTKEIQ